MSISERSLYELIGALKNGVITPEQHARLDEALSKDPAARERYYDYTDVDLQLYRRYASHDPLESASSLQAESPIETSPTQLAKQRRSSAWTHLVAIAATILCVLGLQHLGSEKVNQTASHTITESTQSDSSATYIATVTKSADCVWEGEHGPKFDGQRLLTNELHLKEGIAEFRFDVGVRIVMEGPASLTIDSATSASLTRGKVVLNGSEMTGPFSLHTPVTTLLDIGTEYGAEVEPEGATKVYVFEGEVSVVPRADSNSNLEPQQMTIGQASRFDASGSTPVEFATSRFKRQVPASALPSMNRKDALLAYEGFDYHTPRLGNADGGLGWAGPWSGWYGNEEPSVSEMRFDDALGYGSSLKVVGNKKVSWRNLKVPVRLDVDGVYYVSFLLRKISEVERGKSQYGALELRTADFPSDDSKLSFGMSSERHQCLTHNKQQFLSAPPIPFDEAIRFAVKIVAGQDAPDQVMVRWYDPDEVIEGTEPHIWNCVSQPEFGNAVFSQLVIRAGGDAAYLVDELRLGTNWAAITDGKSTVLDNN